MGSGSGADFAEMWGGVTMSIADDNRRFLDELLADLDNKLPLWWNDWLNMSDHLRDDESPDKVWSDGLIVIGHAAFDLIWRHRVAACGETAIDQRLLRELGELHRMALDHWDDDQDSIRAMIVEAANTPFKLIQAICEHALRVGDNQLDWLEAHEAAQDDNSDALYGASQDDDSDALYGASRDQLLAV
jgi:hypothetical protein